MEKTRGKLFCELYRWRSKATFAARALLTPPPGKHDELTKANFANSKNVHFQLATARCFSPLPCATQLGCHRDRSPRSTDLGSIPAFLSFLIRSSRSVSTKVTEDRPASCLFSLTCSKPPASNCHSTKPFYGQSVRLSPTILYQRAPSSMSLTAMKARTFSMS